MEMHPGNGAQNTDGERSNLRDLGQPTGSHQKRRRALNRSNPWTRFADTSDLRFVQDWVGHAPIKNTVIYAQLTSRRRDEEARRVFMSPYVV
jgi:hypothetical protein